MQNQHYAYIVAGGNIPPKQHYIKKAIDLLERKGLKVENESSVYESEPWGFDAEQDFLNKVFLLRTQRSPHELLKALLNTEKELGRERGETSGYASRRIDLDILFYDRLIVSDTSLEIPHPKIPQRRFVLEPLAEIAADFIHPQLQMTVSELLKQCDDPGKVYKIQED